MHIYAIGDLHFSGVPESKPMNTRVAGKDKTCG